MNHGEDVEVTHSGEAFWIQTRVLKWAGYPEIHTVDEYFDLIERYVAANPVMEDGTPNIPFTILCDGWRYFVWKIFRSFWMVIQMTEAVLWIRIHYRFTIITPQILPMVL